jgi:hypothetical protein
MWCGVVWCGVVWCGVVCVQGLFGKFQFFESPEGAQADVAGSGQYEGQMVPAHLQMQQMQGRYGAPLAMLHTRALVSEWSIEFASRLVFG